MPQFHGADLDAQIAQLRKGNLISEQQVRSLCISARESLICQPNIQPIDPPVTICGDIHGQFFDLQHLFQTIGSCPSTRYLFIGDFVDRGYHSLETLLLLLALRVRYPEQMFLVRGNHESRQITQVYGFYDECMRKFGGGVNVWKYCCDVFDYLPLGAVIGQSILCIHGGLSPSVQTLDEVRLIDRKKETPHQGPMCDLMWSDPEESITGWHTSPRGAGFLFGGDVVEAFLHRNSLAFIARAHQLVQEGYREMFDGKLVTVWSAPNYCYRCGNAAAVLQIDAQMEKEFVVFGAAPLDQRTLTVTRAVPEYFV